jgi:hypothetical protein
VLTPSSGSHPVIDALKHREDGDGFVQLIPRPRFAPARREVRVLVGNDLIEAA